MKKQNFNSLDYKTKYRPSFFSTLIVFVLFIIVGISVLPLLNVQLTPSRSLPGISVSYRWSDASARVIEQEVTSKLEGLFIGVKSINEVSSVSQKAYGIHIDSALSANRYDVMRNQKNNSII
jgi:multidrug efflux pump subunit AcrB